VQGIGDDSVCACVAFTFRANLFGGKIVVKVLRVEGERNVRTRKE